MLMPVTATRCGSISGRVSNTPGPLDHRVSSSPTVTGPAKVHIWMSSILLRFQFLRDHPALCHSVRRSSMYRCDDCKSMLRQHFSGLRRVMRAKNFALAKS